jgi:hypothetical protein
MALGGAPLATLARPMKEGLGALTNLAGVTGTMAAGGQVPRDTVIEAAAKTAGSMADIASPGPSAGGTNIGMFMGRNAAHAPTPSIQAAQGAHAAGASPTDIWLAHGVDVTEPARPRWEISDQNARINNKVLSDLGQEYRKNWGSHRDVSVGDVVDHPELWENYPALARAPFQLMDPSKQAHGSFAPGAYNYKNPTTAPGIVSLNPNAPDPLSTMLHELQHGVQYIEGHPMGANLDIVQEQTRKAVLDRLMEMYAKDLTNPENNRLKAMWDRYSKDPQAKAMINYGIYRRSPGEVEARNTQARHQMSPDERAVFAPWQTADYRPGEVAYNAGFDPKVPWWENDFAKNKPRKP